MLKVARDPSIISNERCEMPKLTPPNSCTEGSTSIQEELFAAGSK